jgi:hypothetical protein
MVAEIANHNPAELRGKGTENTEFFFVTTKDIFVNFAVSHRRAAGLRGTNGVPLW